MRIAALVLVASVCLTVQATAWNAACAAVDLGVAASVSPETAAAGGFLTHSIVVGNAGPGFALDALLVELPPEGMTFEYLLGPGLDEGWRCTTPAVGARGKTSCLNKSMAPGESVTFTIGLRIDWCAGSGPATSEATLVSASAETNPSDNTATVFSDVVDAGACDDGSLCTLSDHCAPGPGFEENFDSVAVPTLPSGWTAAFLIGPVSAPAWRSVGGNFDTPPYSLFSAGASEVRDAVLDSPQIRILSPNAQLTFRNRYDLEPFFDGGVLEIKIGDGLFEDITSVGGSFAAGDYDGTISTFYGSPIGGRRAWTGVSGGFVTTVVDLPAGAARNNVVFRWRLASDRNRGQPGQWIDSVFVTGRDECHAGTSIGCDDANACTVDGCDAIAGCTHVALLCDDGNTCTDDSCDPHLQCVHASNTGACDDFDVCTQSDRCTSGVCVGSNALTCSDADLCTPDICDPANGCVATTANLAAAGFSAVRVDGRDLAVFADAWSSCSGDTRYAVAADLDPRDACIDAADFHLFMEAFGRDCGS